MAAEWVKNALMMSLTVLGGIAGVSIICIILYSIFYPWAERILTYYQNKSSRELASFTVYTKDKVLDAVSIAGIQKTINKELITRWINARTVISVMHSPHVEGHQFTVWYKERLLVDKYSDPEPIKQYPNNIKRIY